MSDQEFQAFLTTHVVLEDEPFPLRGKVAEVAIADAFGLFEQASSRGVSIR